MSVFEMFYKSHNGLCDRIIRHKFLKSEIEGVITDKWKVCINKGDFFNSLESVTKITSGSFGDIYKARLKNVDFIIKESYIAPYMLKKLGLIPGKDWTKIQYPPEAAICLMTNDILESGESPNFIYVLGSYFCKPCKIRSICYTLLTELTEGDLTAFDNARFTKDAIAQLLMGLNVLHKKYGLIHQDIKAENILFKRINAKGSFKYETKNRVFYIPNNGYIFMLADFGSSSSVKPDYAFNAFLGTRNFKVEPSNKSIEWGENAGLEYIIKPFNVKLKPIFSTYKYTVKNVVSNHPVRRWTNDDNKPIGEYTDNIMSDNDLKPEIKVDLNDVVTFPPLEFAGDVQDVIRTFVGGYRYFQPYFIHKGFKIESQQLQDLVTYRNCVDLSTTNSKSLKYIFADLTVAFLFPEFKILTDIVVDDFKFNTF